VAYFKVCYDCCQSEDRSSTFLRKFGKIYQATRLYITEDSNLHTVPVFTWIHTLRKTITEVSQYYIRYLNRDWSRLPLEYKSRPLPLDEYKVKVKISLLDAWRPLGLRNFEALTFLIKTANRWRQGCQPYAPAALYSPGRFLVLISVRG
jgi:hypothetical protein